LIFIIRRGDTDRLEPFEAVDPEFAELLCAPRDVDIGITAMSINGHPPR
jgi:DNA-binding sugar fermentation-stimulating protein